MAGANVTVDDQLFNFIIKRELNMGQDKLIMTCLGCIATFITDVSEQTLEFIFNSVYNAVSRLKSKYPRGIFKYMVIYLEVLEYLKRLANQTLEANPKWRIQIFKTLSILCFDDMLDDFRKNVRESIEMIMNKEATTEDIKYEIMLYDLIGILEGID